MNVQAITISVQRSAIRLVCRGLVVAVLGAGTGQAATEDGDDYQRNILWNPSEAVLLAEHRGRVTIFDGLDSQVVDQALDRQFERIDRLMFVRTRYLQDDGSEEWDDDCD